MAAPNPPRIALIRSAGQRHRARTGYETRWRWARSSSSRLIRRAPLGGTNRLRDGLLPSRGKIGHRLRTKNRSFADRFTLEYIGLTPMSHDRMVPWYHVGSSLRVVKLHVSAISQEKYTFTNLCYLS
jgi:hypothetical protein